MSALLSLVYFSVAASAAVWSSPVQTAPADDDIDPRGWTPKPTPPAGVKELLRRLSSPNTVCGYISGNASVSACSPIDRATEPDRA